MKRAEEAFFRKKSVKKLLINTFLFLFLLPLTITWGVLTIQSERLVVASAIENRKAFVGLMGAVIEKELKQYNSDIQALASDNRLCQILADADFTAYGSKLLYDFKYLDTLIYNVIGTDRNVENLIVVNSAGQVYCNTYMSSEQKAALLEGEWYQHTIALNGKTNFIGRSLGADGSVVFSVARLIIDKNLRAVGVIRLSYTESILRDALSDDVNLSSDAYIVSQGMAILYSTCPEAEPKIEALLAEESDVLTGSRHALCKLDGRRVLLMSSRADAFGLQIVNQIDHSSIKQDSNIVQLSIALILLFSVAAFILSITRFYFKFSVPINKMLAYLSREAGGDGELSGGEWTCYELSCLSDHMVALIKKTRQGDVQLKTLVHQYETATLEKLQAQINPHFLYNTLTTIKYAAVSRNETEIADLITALVKLMRCLIGRNGAFVRVSEEIQTLKYYLFIEENIYRHSFKVEYDVEKAAEDYMTPSFLLQPLVENCIFHGIDLTGGGNIKITARKEDNAIAFEVRDDGRGMRADDGEKPSENNRPLTNFGIAGVSQKLKLLFNDARYQLRIFSAEGSGTLVRITIPLILQGEEADYAQSTAY